jgi:hypothetical protein
MLSNMYTLEEALIDGRLEWQSQAVPVNVPTFKLVWSRARQFAAVTLCV